MSTPWYEYSLAGEFQISFPAAAKAEWQEDGSLLVINYRGTDVLLKKRTFQGASEVASEASLEGLVMHYCAETIYEVTGVRHGASVKSSRLPDGRTIVVQGLAKGEAGQWWVARAIAREGANEYFFITWFGPEELLKDPVLEILESFVMAGSTNSG